jgi:membrane protein
LVPPGSVKQHYRGHMSASPTSATAARGGKAEVAPSLLARIRANTWRLLSATLGACLRYRVTGLAAEIAFFAILSLPPLLFGLVGTVGYVADKVTTIEAVKQETLDLFARALTEETVNEVIRPTLNDVLDGGRADVISVGFILALWSGSRALNVIIDTISIMYGLGGRRGIVKTRALSFSLYMVALLIGVIVLPLVVVGPTLVDQMLPTRLDFVVGLYWPTVLVLSIGFLATLYHVSVPVRTSWRYDIPGAAFTMLAWLGGSALLRWFLQGSIGDDSTSIYGPLAAPIAILIWLYVLSIAVLIGAAVNAAFDRVFPANTTARARLELVRRLRAKAAEVRMREGGLTEAEIADEPTDTMSLHALAGGVAPTDGAPLRAEHLEVQADRVLEEVRQESKR